MPMSRRAMMAALTLTSAFAAQPASAETPKDTLVIVSEMGPNGLDTMVPTANDHVTFSITGPAKLIGVGNGDPTCHERDKGSCR